MIYLCFFVNFFFQKMNLFLIVVLVIISLLLLFFALYLISLKILNSLAKSVAGSLVGT